MSEIIAKRDEGVYLVKLSEEEGRVIDLSASIAHSKFNLQSILARGYWKELGNISDQDKNRVLELNAISLKRE